VSIMVDGVAGDSCWVSGRTAYFVRGSFGGGTRSAGGAAKQERSIMVGGVGEMFPTDDPWAFRAVIGTRHCREDLRGDRF
jgi:hypothetical protein